VVNARSGGSVDVGDAGAGLLDGLERDPRVELPGPARDLGVGVERRLGPGAGEAVVVIQEITQLRGRGFPQLGPVLEEVPELAHESIDVHWFRHCSGGETRTLNLSVNSRLLCH
jgi:hypothetical protein